MKNIDRYPHLNFPKHLLRNSLIEYLAGAGHVCLIVFAI